jgi:hypothetical protein
MQESYSLIYIPVLTQLTHLYLEYMQLEHFITTPDNRRPLADMTNLVSLRLFGADVAVGAPCALPPNLTKLNVDMEMFGVGNWVVHLGACQRLRELQLTMCWREFPVHPTRLIRGIAQQLTGLVKLRVALDSVEAEQGDEQDVARQVLANVLAEVQGEVAAGEGDEAAEQEDFSKLPIAGHCWQSP